VRLTDLVETSDAVARVSGRLDKINRLASLLSRLSPDEIEIGIGFLTGSPRHGRIGLGWSLISGARTTDPATEPTLELRDVDDVFGRIAQVSGSGATTERRRLLRDLLARATPREQDFLTRLLMGDLRQGALEGVLLEAVARAAGVGSAALRRATMASGDLGLSARAALIEGEAGLAPFAIQLLRPVQPMLADTAAGVEEALERLGRATFELKLDGARVQAHKAGDEVRLYSRTLRDVTPAAPEIVEAIRALPARELILDGEVIALRPDETPYPFQMTMQRFGRRLDVERQRAERPLTAFFFDCLYVDGTPLIDEPQSGRLAILREQAPGLVIPHVSDASPAEAQMFLDSALARGHEGAMAKDPDAPYVAGRRGQSWLKIKAAKSLDLVVLAAEWGSGRRQGWLSNLHLGARGPKGTFVMLGKTFKGLTDEMLAWQTARLLELEIGRDRHIVHVRPELVVEIAFNDLQESPVYPGRLALRFARVKRYRTDKRADEADTFTTVQDLYRGATGMEPPPVV
jgi:DNA ligase-1